MSRNSRRTSVPQAAAPQRPTVPQASAGAKNPFGMSFVVPTETVTLPSGAKFYEPESSMFGKSSVEIKQMTAREEEILSNYSYAQDGTIIDRLISSVLTDVDIKVEDISAPDKNAIIIAARRSSYGSSYEVTSFCENCNSEQQFIFDLDKAQIKDETPEGVSLNSDTGIYTFTLPKTELVVEARSLSPEDERYLSEQTERAKKLNLPNSETINFLKKLVVSVNGYSDPSQLAELFEVLPVLDVRKIKKVSKEMVPVLDTTQEVACGGCSETSEREVPFSLGFFWPDI